MPFRSKEAVVDAILANRESIEGCCCAGNSNSLMNELGMTTSKVYKEFCLAKQEERMDPESQNDLIGFTVQAVDQKQLDDRHLLAMCANELNDAEKFEVYAADIHAAHSKAGGSTFDCPVLVPKGQKARDKYPALFADQESAQKKGDTTDSEKVLNDLEKCVADLGTIEEDLAANHHSGDKLEVSMETDSSDGDTVVVRADASGKDVPFIKEDQHGLAVLVCRYLNISTNILTRMGVPAAITTEPFDKFVLPVFENLKYQEENNLHELANKILNMATGPAHVVAAELEKKLKQISYASLMKLTNQSNSTQSFLDSQLDDAESEIAKSGSTKSVAATTSGSVAISQEQMHKDYETGRQNMETMMSNHETMVRDYEKKMLEADRMLSKHEKQMDRLKVQLSDAKAEARHNEERLHTAVDAVREHFGAQPCGGAHNSTQPDKTTQSKNSVRNKKRREQITNKKTEASKVKPSQGKAVQVKDAKVKDAKVKDAKVKDAKKNS